MKLGNFVMVLAGLAIIGTAFYGISSFENTVFAQGKATVVVKKKKTERKYRYVRTMYAHGYIDAITVNKILIKKS